MRINHFKRIVRLGLTLSMLGIVPLSQAADINLSGFASFVYAKTVSDKKEGDADGTPLDGESRDFNKFGLRMHSDLGDGLSFTTQVIANGSDDYDPKIDWLYVNYVINSKFDVSIGKTRMPIYLYSDTLDVSFAYPWLVAPKSVYSSSDLSSLDGVNISYQDSFGEVDVNIQVYGGEDELSEEGYSILQENAFGITATAQYEWLTIRAGFLTADITLNAEQLDSLIAGVAVTGEALGVDLSEVIDGLEFKKDTRNYFSLGAEVDLSHSFYIAEYRSSSTDPNMLSEGTEGFYLTAGAKLPANWMVSITYGSRERDESDSKTLEAYNDALASRGQDPETFAGVPVAGLLFSSGEKIEELIFSSRWNFHPKASLKMEYVLNDIEENEMDLTVVNREPNSFRVGIDLAF